MAPEERWQKIENTMQFIVEMQARLEANMAEAQARLARTEERDGRINDRLDLWEKRILRLTRIGVREAVRNRKEHARIHGILDRLALRDTEIQEKLDEMTDKLNVLIDIEQRRQPPQQ